MPPARLPANETARLTALRSYDVLDTACEASFENLAFLAAKLTGTPTALVSLVDEDRQWLKARFGCNLIETPRSSAFCAYAVLDPSQPLIVGDATQDVRFLDNPLVTGPPFIRFYAGVPLVDPEGFALGTLCVLDQNPREFPPESIEILTSLAQAVMTTLQLRRAVRQVASLAMTDALTGLPNRPAFMQALDQAIARQTRDGSPFTLLYLDLDGLKQINDTLGHAVGDRVLIAAAAALRASMRKQDTPARLGGDEFGAVLVGGDGSEAELAAERVRSGIENYMREAGWPVTASVGSAVFEQSPHSAIGAITAVDRLMYEAKAAGRNRIVSRRISRGMQQLAEEIEQGYEDLDFWPDGPAASNLEPARLIDHIP